MRSACEFESLVRQRYLQVIGQLGAAGVSRVHGDEDGTGRVELQLRTLKHQRLGVNCDSYAETRTSQKFYRANRQNANGA